VQTVHMVTPADVAAGRFSLFDVVLPLISRGRAVVLPQVRSLKSVLFISGGTSICLLLVPLQGVLAFLNTFYPFYLIRVC